MGNNGIRTLNGGNISVTAQFGDVNTGGNYKGYLFGQTASALLQGLPQPGRHQHCAGGDVTITAGGNVTSFLPRPEDDY